MHTMHRFILKTQPRSPFAAAILLSLQVELDALIPKQRQSALGEITSPLPSSQSSSAACAGIGLPQLCEYMARKLALQEPDEVVRRAFRAFDTTAKGYVNFSDFQAAVATFAAGLPQQTVELCFSQLDADGDGRVSFRDFATMMSTLRPDGRAAGLVAPAAARFAGAGGAPRTTQPLATM